MTNGGTYTIKHYTDSFECDCCGGSFATGYQISKDGEILVDKKPSAYCYASTSYESYDLKVDLTNLIFPTMQCRGDYSEDDYYSFADVLGLILHGIVVIVTADSEDLTYNHEYDPDY